MNRQVATPKKYIRCEQTNSIEGSKNPCSHEVFSPLPSLNTEDPLATLQDTKLKGISLIDKIAIKRGSR